MTRHHKWLQGEIDHWIQEGIIGPDQGKAIRKRYEVREGTDWGGMIFPAIGAVLVGLGIILFFAYNWDSLHRYAKLGVIFGGLAAAHGGGLFLADRHPALSSALHVLGTMVFGSGIWLVAQIYHIDEHFPNAFLYWGIGALALAWTLPSAAQGIMAAILLVVWNGAEVFGFSNPNHAAPFVIGIGIGLLAWRLRSVLLAAVVVPAFLAALGFTVAEVAEALTLSVLFSWACIFMALGRGGEGAQRPAGGRLMGGYGAVLYLGLLYLLTFPNLGEEVADLALTGAADRLYFWGSAALALVLWSFLLRRLLSGLDVDLWDLLLHCLIPPVSLVLLVSRVTTFGDWHPWAWAALFNLLFLGHALALIADGCRTVDLKTTAAGCLLFALLAGTRYVDLFDSLLLRALVFGLVGISLFLIGGIYTKARRRALKAES